MTLMVVVAKFVMTMIMVNGIIVNSILHVHTTTSMVAILIVDGKSLVKPIVLPSSCTITISLEDFDQLINLRDTSKASHSSHMPPYLAQVLPFALPH